MNTVRIYVPIIFVMLSPYPKKMSEIVFVNMCQMFAIFVVGLTDLSQNWLNILLRSIFLP